MSLYSDTLFWFWTNHAYKYVSWFTCLKKLYMCLYIESCLKWNSLGPGFVFGRQVCRFIQVKLTKISYIIGTYTRIWLIKDSA